MFQRTRAFKNSEYHCDFYTCRGCQNSCQQLNAAAFSPSSIIVLLRDYKNMWITKNINQRIDKIELTKLNLYGF